VDGHALVRVALLLAIGGFSGVLGTIVGLGGGFIAVPLLRLAFGTLPAAAAGASLVMVVANAVSGSIAYTRQKRADVPTAVLVGIGGLPGSIAGALLVRHAPATGFDALYGALLLVFFGYILRRRTRPNTTRVATFAGMRERTLVDAYGERFTFGFHPPTAIAIGIVLGFMSSFFGIGGGVIFFAAFISIFGMPAHIISATSTLAILLTSPAGVAAHALQGDIDWHAAIPLAVGGTLGGQIGPQIARRLSSRALVTTLAFAIFLAGLALALNHR